MAHAEVSAEVEGHPGEVTVVAIGPLTNVAGAMLLDPQWDTKVARLVVIAGAFDLPNVLQELNSSYDPEATHLVLNSAAPLDIVPLEALRQHAVDVPDDISGLE